MPLLRNVCQSGQNGISGSLDTRDLGNRRAIPGNQGHRSGIRESKSHRTLKDLCKPRAPEVFQRTMTSILGDLKGVVCHIDDTLVHAATQAEHDERLRTVLKRLQVAGVTLNEKCEFSKRSVKFLGHIIDEQGIRPDPAKTEAIRNFPVPQKVNDLQRFMGMVNQMAKFIPNLANLNEPLRQLLKKENMWKWDKAQQQSFEGIKNELTSATNLAHYDPSRPTVISSDASNFGLGAVLLQLQEDGTRKPVYYASRSLSETEKRYAVIEKEALAVTWACDKFSDYVLGMKFTVETDHKPLVPLFTSTDLSKMPPRILRFRMRLMKYELDVVYVPGKEQITADTLSRAPIEKNVNENIDLVEEVESFTQQIVAGLPATPKRLQDISEAQDQDEVCRMIKKYCLEGWPAYMPSSTILRPYWENKKHLTVIDKILLYDDRIVIPAGMRLEILDLLHQGHLGITKTQARGKMSVWWPAITTAITDMTKAGINTFNEHTIFLGTLLCGSEKWKTYPRQERHLNTFHMRSLRRILGISWQDKVRNKEVLSRVGLPSMFTLVRQRGLRWRGYVHRMPEGRIPKYLLYVELATGSKRTGRPQLRYREAVKRDVKAVRIDIETWENLAADRSQWRGTVTKHLKTGMEKLT
ncbi:Retrovirus-related Pol polyprotein from transposon 17.6 [Stylophora pistillata]|uniref:Retrovirus-related Pol polyprotein from transposon 17.6 n=1 Tax=Stylophora pistillata TaxID=50429 RepID=A0A2B4R693_STYPI|nr:Retrovirus-related Pol polyprotein from transposon 17.6 [Stylophora pistillata]